jgi:hypothetical protein
LDALAVGIMQKRVNWVLDADIRDFFGQLDRAWLRKFLQHRIADKRVLRLIDKWLAAGVIENGEWSATEEGSPQGALCSAEHNAPNEQCWVMRSAGLLGAYWAWSRWRRGPNAAHNVEGVKAQSDGQVDVPEDVSDIGQLDVCLI